MALLTNNVREWEPRWRAMLPEIDEIFEVVVDSAFVGMRKPEPADLRAHARAPRRRAWSRAIACSWTTSRSIATPHVRSGWAAVAFEETDQAIGAIEAALERG